MGTFRHSGNRADQAQALWQETALPSPHQQFPHLSERTHCDVAIVGGGFTGLSAALHLAQAGVNCVVLEANDIGHGGSGRNVGLVNAGLWLPPEKVVAELGEEVGARLNRALDEGPSLVFSLVEKYGIDCEALRNGTLHLAHSAAGLRGLESRHRQLSALGAPVHLHDREITRAMTGSANYFGALQDMRAGTIQPLGYARGLARAAVSEGAAVHCHSRVTSLSPETGKWALKTDQGKIWADKVILASNAYSDALWPALNRTIIPIHFFQCASEPLGDDAGARVLPERHGCWDTQMLMLSVRKDRVGRLIFGSVGATRGTADNLITAWASRMTRQLFPQLGKLQWSHCWQGRIAFTPNHIPRMHQLAPGVITCIGYNGRGISPGTTSGKAMAELLLGVAPVDAFPLPVQPLKPVALNRLRARLAETAARIAHFAQGRVTY